MLLLELYTFGLDDTTTCRPSTCPGRITYYTLTTIPLSRTTVMEFEALELFALLATIYDRIVTRSHYRRSLCWCEFSNTERLW